LLKDLRLLSDKAYEIEDPIPKEQLFDEIAGVCLRKLEFCLRPDKWWRENSEKVSEDNVKPDERAAERLKIEGGDST
jgi:hypothetical protein